MDAVRSLVWCRPTIGVQLALVGVQWVLWSVFIPLAVPLIEARIKRQPWGSALVAHYREANRKVYIHYPDAESALREAARLMAVVPQHVIGGLLCVPAVYPSIAAALGIERARAVSLAMHGALSEVGWEVQDCLMRGRELLFSPRARAPSPLAWTAVLAMHHSVGLVLVLPMNLAFGDEPAYHELVLLLQGASALGVVATFYVMALDTTRPAQLRQMQVVATGILLLFLYARCGRYTQLAFELRRVVIRAGAGPRLLIPAHVGMGALGLVNVGIAYGAFGRFTKYVLMPHMRKTQHGHGR